MVGPKYQLPLIIVWIMLAWSVPTLAGDEPKRTAIVVDRTGVETQVTGLSFRDGGAAPHFESFQRTKPTDDGRRRLFYDGGFPLVTETLQFEIPFRFLVSIAGAEDKEGSAKVCYQWCGKRVSLTGKLASGSFVGKSDFGEFRLAANKLRELRFKDEPDRLNETDEELNRALESPRATLLLTDGSEVSARYLRRYNSHDSLSSAAGMLVLPNYHYRDILVLRGDSLLTVPLSQLKAIEFGKDRTITITSANGQSVSGRIPTEDRKPKGDLEGFTGVSESGNFFTDRKHVKSISIADTK